MVDWRPYVTYVYFLKLIDFLYQCSENKTFYKLNLCSRRIFLRLRSQVLEEPQVCQEAQLDQGTNCSCISSPNLVLIPLTCNLPDDRGSWSRHRRLWHSSCPHSYQISIQIPYLVRRNPTFLTLDTSNLLLTSPYLFLTELVLTLPKGLNIYLNPYLFILVCVAKGLLRIVLYARMACLSDRRER